MPLTPSLAYSSGYHDNSPPGPSQPTPSQRLLSQILPAHPHSSHHPKSCPAKPCVASHSPRGTATATVTVTAKQASPIAPSVNATPTKSSLRLSHPPPAPSFSDMHQLFPQSKRARQRDSSSRSATAATSPLTESSSALFQSNTSSAPTGSLSSPSPNVRPLSGISRPLPTPSTPSPSQRSVPSNAGNVPLIPMPQRTVQDFEKLLPRRQPSSAPTTDALQHALLQAIPPQPPVPPPSHVAPLAYDLAPLPSATETLPRRTGWSLTGFRSFDLDLVRIADVVSLEQARNDSSDVASTEDDAQSTSRPASRNGPRIQPPHLGHSDRGLPSGSILEVLGPSGSGKSSFLLQFAITERLRALGKAREALATHSADADTLLGGDIDLEGGTEGEGTPFTDSCYFTQDFWDAEISTADQVFLIDCEGALSPERVADAAWTAVISLWMSTQEQPNSTRAAEHAGVSSIPAATKQDRSETPEEVRRLVTAVLAGIHLSRVVSLAGLIALLHSLRPTDEYHDGQSKKGIPTALPLRTSLVLIDSLSYHIRSPGGSSQDRKVAAQVTDRIRQMLLRLQKPFEYRSQPGVTIEEQKQTRTRCREAASRLCTPTILFTNQLGIRRGQKERDSFRRGSPLGRSTMGSGSGRSSNTRNARGEGLSLLAPILNGVRPPQPASMRDEPPAPSVALCGPEMWEGEEPAKTAPGHLQDLKWRNSSTQPMGHDRGWPPSFLGQDVWRILLFRHGTFGYRYAQLVSIPPAIQNELSALWVQTRERVRARATAFATGDDQGFGVAHSTDVERRPSHTRHNEPEQIEAPSTALEKQTGEDPDKKMLKLLSQLRTSLFRWRPFHVTSRGLNS
ncbi:uncharacterized protein MEPE_02212 [Melanopsichium pennsylvanicum]|uniref:Uncharacterized protein n=2 Tax=Melanopsichium pennsylvanicum TaxID=63383 RepID=A0AAJ5C4B1_9BASI|nr:hypothetical protein BN887_05004 [Melanopsichium pennsylvanicum 4]SNX83505.1 uncharacterized protein MEPE_02212 [Melanopsichium pennsylvanicum]